MLCAPNLGLLLVNRMTGWVARMLLLLLRMMLLVDYARGPVKVMWRPWLLRVMRMVLHHDSY